MFVIGYAVIRTFRGVISYPVDHCRSHFAAVSASNSCLSDDELQHFANRVLDAERSGLVTSKQSNNWDIHGSMFFAMTVVTTIGRFHYPSTGLSDHYQSYWV